MGFAYRYWSCIGKGLPAACEAGLFKHTYWTKVNVGKFFFKASNTFKSSLLSFVPFQVWNVSVLSYCDTSLSQRVHGRQGEEVSTSFPSFTVPALTHSQRDGLGKWRIYFHANADSFQISLVYSVLWSAWCILYSETNLVYSVLSYAIY